jgi:membrane-associated phospholipid phosphatase
MERDTTIRRVRQVPEAGEHRTVPRMPVRRLVQLDSAALVTLRTRCHAPAIERAVRSFSRTGEHAACWLALGAAGAAVDRARPERRRAWVRGLETVAFAYAANYLVKIVVRRRRPELPTLPPLTPTVSRLSFPSAHATTSFAAARAYHKVAPAKPLYAVATAFALSRPYLGVHYPSDVLAGAALGTAISMGATIRCP